MVKFETVFNNEVSKSINKMQMKKLTWVYVVFTILFALFGGVEIFTYYENPAEADLIFGIVMLAFGVCFFPLCKLLTFLIQKKIDKSMPVMSNNTNETFEFYEDKIIIKTVNDELYRSQVEASYKYIHKIVENSEAYYLYISKVQCHVVMKRCIVEGNLSDLSVYLDKNFNSITARGVTLTYKNIVNK